MARQVLRARDGFILAAPKGGAVRVVHEGDVFMSDDPVVKGREELFIVINDVEQATAAPGEKRAVSVPTKPATKK